MKKILVLLLGLGFYGSIARADNCSFNGRQESCSVVSRHGNSKTIRWNSDGKIVTYNFYNCREEPGTGGTAERCEVKIVEDNGRTSYGTSVGGGRGSSIYSQNGNNTLLPP